MLTSLWLPLPQNSWTKPKECVENEKIFIKNIQSKLENVVSLMIMSFNGSFDVKFCLEVDLDVMAWFMNLPRLGIAIF